MTYYSQSFFFLFSIFCSNKQRCWLLPISSSPWILNRRFISRVFHMGENYFVFVLFFLKNCLSISNPNRKYFCTFSALTRGQKNYILPGPFCGLIIKAALQNFLWRNWYFRKFIGVHLFWSLKNTPGLWTTAVEFWSQRTRLQISNV